MRVKICGMMRPADVQTAVDYGADAVGFVVASPASHRNLTLSKARSLMKTVPVFATKVAVTASHDSRIMRKICSSLKPDALQVHKHDPKFIRTIRKNYSDIDLISATAIRNQSSINRARRSARYSNAVLADSPGSGAMGGTGRPHDWKLTAELRESIYPHPLILAGGLTPNNVQMAIRMVKPFAVDVSTGVEARIGVKDHVKMKGFIMNAKEIMG